MSGLRNLVARLGLLLGVVAFAGCATGEIEEPEAEDLAELEESLQGTDDVGYDEGLDAAEAPVVFYGFGSDHPDLDVTKAEESGFGTPGDERASDPGHGSEPDPQPWRSNTDDDRDPEVGPHTDSNLI